MIHKEKERAGEVGPKKKASESTIHATNRYF